MRVVVSELAEAGLRGLNLEWDRSDALRLAILHFLSLPATRAKSQPLVGPDHDGILFYRYLLELPI